MPPITLTLNIQEAIVKAVINKLAAAMVAGGALSYVTALKQGNNDETITGQLPCIIVSPKSISEKFRASRFQKEMLMTLEIRGIMNVPDNSQVISSVSTDGLSVVPGICKLDADIKNVLEDDLTLGGKALSFEIDTSEMANVGGNTANTWRTVIKLTAQQVFIKGAR